MKRHGPWTILSSREAYQDPWLKVVRDEVIRPDGMPGSYATVELKSGVCVLAVDAAGCLRLTKEFHYAVGRVTIEGVSGGIEVGETPQQAACRELQEELGWLASSWQPLGRVDPFTAAIRSTVDIMLATGLSKVPANPEGTEQIEEVVVDLGSAVAMVRESQITHGPTCIGILQLALQQTLNGQSSP